MRLANFGIVWVVKTKRFHPNPVETVDVANGSPTTIMNLQLHRSAGLLFPFRIKVLVPKDAYILAGLNELFHSFACLLQTEITFPFKLKLYYLMKQKERRKIFEMVLSSKDGGRRPTNGKTAIPP